MQLFANGSAIGLFTADASGAWSGEPGLADGAHDLTVVDTTTSDTSVDLNITLETAAPALSAGLSNDTGASDADGITSDPTVVGMTAAGATVVATENSLNVGSATADFSGNYVLVPTIAAGPHTLTLSATDLAGNVSMPAPVGLDLLLQAAPPTASLAHDTGASQVDGITSDPTIAGAATAGDVVDLLEGGVVIGSASADSGGAYSITPVLADGVHTIVATLTNAAGNTASAPSVQIDLESAPPPLTIALQDDTGLSSTDGITMDASLAGITSPNATVAIDSITLPTPVAIATLFGTGVDGNGVAAPGLADQHWSVTYAPTGTTATPVAIAASLPDSWVADTSASTWITPNSAALGFYDYKETFDLTGLDPTTARIDGKFSAADVAGLVLNGRATGDNIYYGSSVLTDFSLADGFVAGLNTLDVYLLHTIDQGPTGLQVQLGGTADVAGQSTPTVVNLGTVQADDTGAWMAQVTPPIGSGQIVATATSVAGVTTSSPIAVDYEPGVPQLTGQLTSPDAVDSTTRSPVLSGLTAPFSQVAFTDSDLSFVGVTTANAAGAWIFQPSVPNGAHDFAITATSPAGVASPSIDVAFDVATAPPPLSATLADDDGTSSTDGVTTDPTISGQTTPGATVTFSEPQPVVPVAITTLFGTGLDAAGGLIADGSADPHYQVTYLPTLVTSAATTLSSASGLLTPNGGPYAADTAASGWISPNNWAGGDYIYKTTFDLTGLDPTTARIDGAWSVDNVGAIVLNGSNTGIVDFNGAAESAAFSITSGFVAGINTLEFYVYNGDQTPTGIEVSLTGSANPDAAAVAAQSSLGSIVAAEDGSYSFTPTGLQVGAQTIDVAASDQVGNTAHAPVDLTLVTWPQSAPFLAPAPTAPSSAHPTAAFADASATAPASWSPQPSVPTPAISQVAPLHIDPVPFYVMPTMLPQP